MEKQMRDHAIVIGGSIGGLTTASVLASRFERVTVLERQAPPQEETSIAPHGRYPHVLLEGGLRAFERMLPGFTDALRAGGGPEASGGDALRWWADGWRAPRPATHVRGTRVLASRHLVESTVRRRVAAMPNVAVRHGVTIDALAHHRDGRVIGVRTAQGSIEADLVVDCSGRGSRTPQWLTELGYEAPRVSEIGVDLTYLTLFLRRKPTDLDGKRALIVQNLAPEVTRMGLAVAIENDQWMVVIGGYFGDMPPRDRAGYLAFARSLPVPDLAHLLESCDVIGEPLPYKFASSRRVHFEKVALPAGFVVLGDAMCSFNPIYAQGMTVAAVQAEALGAALDRGEIDDVQRELARIAHGAWLLAAGADLGYPEVVGERTRVSAWIRSYMRKVFRACSVDGEVVAALWDVTNLIAPASSLFRPAVVMRVLRGNRRVLRDRAAAARGGWHPAPSSSQASLALPLR
jgi:2-polyprenyl-6-methoxyphenol hydroxylase-like FAD-dependent oxidoreductase